MKSKRISKYRVFGFSAYIFLWTLATETLLAFSLGISVFSNSIYWTPPVVLALVGGVTLRLFPRRSPAIGKIEDLEGQEMLTLVQNLDRAYDAIGLRYGLRVLAAFGVMLLILVMVFIFVFVASFSAVADKLTLGVALLALVLALGSFALQYIESTVTERLEETLSDYFFVRVKERYSQKVYPVIRAVIAARLKVRKGLKLEDLYNLEPSLFEQKALLEKLLE